MSREFIIPNFFRSSTVARIKKLQNQKDLRKKDTRPLVLALPEIEIVIARHFGFCYGVQNAIEIAFRAVEENPGKRIYLLSEMIHNPHVNEELRSRGVQFLMDTHGQELIDRASLQPDDIVIVPAFGTTVEMMKEFEGRGISLQRYNTTCPFVEKVWKRSSQLGEKGFAIVIHGKNTHEETRATFSHAREKAPSVIIRDETEAQLLCAYIRGEKNIEEFPVDFAGRYSPDFQAARDLFRLGVVNQTTMLATETQAIADMVKQALITRFGESEIGEHFADTRDTLCYATYENQSAIHGLLKEEGDLAIVVGGYNSSNTSHLVEILEEHLPTYYIQDASEILSAEKIRHLDLKDHALHERSPWFLKKEASEGNQGQPVRVFLSAGASCPDSLVESVMARLVELFSSQESLELALVAAESSLAA